MNKKGDVIEAKAKTQIDIILPVELKEAGLANLATCKDIGTVMKFNQTGTNISPFFSLQLQAKTTRIRAIKLFTHRNASMTEIQQTSSIHNFIHLHFGILNVQYSMYSTF